MRADDGGGGTPRAVRVDPGGSCGGRRGARARMGATRARDGCGEIRGVVRARAWAWCARAWARGRHVGGVFGALVRRASVARTRFEILERLTAFTVTHTTGLLHNSNTMPGTQSVYVSLSILALTGLVGTGVAIGSGVSMMAMQMAEEEKKSAVVASVKETTYRPASRGFAASN